MKRILLGVGILLFTAVLNAQDIAKTITDYEETKSTIISKGRKLLLDQFVADRIDKVEEVYTYLNDKVADIDYAAFNAFEQINLSCWTRRYEYALKEILYLDSLSTARKDVQSSGPSRIYPENDRLSTRIYEKTAPVLSSVLNNIETSELSREQKEVLQLIMKDIYLTGNNRSKSPFQDSINVLSTKFLSSYPASPYANYIRNSVRFVYHRNDWGFGYDFGLGYTQVMGSTADNYKNGFNANGGIDIYYKQTVAYIRFLMSTSGTKHSVVANQGNVIPPETFMNFNHFEFSLGYALPDLKLLTVTPFAGIGAFGISYGTAEERTAGSMLKNAGKTVLCYQGGLNLDFNLTKKNTTEGKIPLRLRCTYIKPANMIYKDMNTEVLTLSLGLSLQGWGTKREL
jgi:hypothetical protein